MKINLMNFGDNNRFVHDVNRKPVLIGIGQCEEVDVVKPTFDFLVAAQATDSLVIVPSAPDLPAPMRELMELMANVHSLAYDELLVQVNKLIGPLTGNTRPNVTDIKTMLRDRAAAYCRAYLNNVYEGDDTKAEPAKKDDTIDPLTGGDRVIHDDVDPKDLEREQNREQAKPKKSNERRAAKRSKPAKPAKKTEAKPRARIRL
jgi:hypothetical protein